MAYITNAQLADLQVAIEAALAATPPAHDCTCACHDDYFKLADPGDHYVR